MKTEIKDDWEERFRAWKRQKEAKKEAHVQEKSAKKEHIPFDIDEEIKEELKKTERFLRIRKPLFTFLIILGAFLLFFTFLLLAYNNSTGFILGLIGIFLILIPTYHYYQKSIHKINPRTILTIGYALLFLNIVLQIQYYTVEWAFLIVILVAVLFYDFKIDSRFFILPALLLLAYIPFLLYGRLNALAEIIAVYVYYFLVMGVILMIIEHYKNTSLKLDFDVLSRKLLHENFWITAVIVLGIISTLAIVLNRFYSIEFWKWTSVYLFFVSLALYFISSTIKKQSQDSHF